MTFHTSYRPLFIGPENQVPLLDGSQKPYRTDSSYLNPIHRLAEKAHAVGAQILVDCAQLAPHRQIAMLGLSVPACLDYVAISAHMVYVPFGTGVLVGRKDTFK